MAAGVHVSARASLQTLWSLDTIQLWPKWLPNLLPHAMHSNTPRLGGIVATHVCSSLPHHHRALWSSTGALCIKAWGCSSQHLQTCAAKPSLCVRQADGVRGAQPLHVRSYAHALLSVSDPLPPSTSSWRTEKSSRKLSICKLCLSQR